MHMFCSRPSYKLWGLVFDGVHYFTYDFADIAGAAETILPRHVAQQKNVRQHSIILQQN